jgi:hypothetical protein
MEPIRDYASASFTNDLVSEQDGETFASELFSVLNRPDIYAVVVERRISLDTIISPGFDRNWIVPPHPDQTKAPSLRLVSTLCPNSPGVPTYLRVFFHGEGFDTANFGILDERVVLRGMYRVDSLTPTNLGPNEAPSCHFDLTLVS